MSYELTYLSEAIDDMEKLDGSQRKMVRKALGKLKDNPLPQSEGGYGRIFESQTAWCGTSHRLHLKA